MLICGSIRCGFGGSQGRGPESFYMTVAGQLNQLSYLLYVLCTFGLVDHGSYLYPTIAAPRRRHDI